LLGRPTQVLCRWRRDRQQRAHGASVAADDRARLRDTRTDARSTIDMTAVTDVENATSIANRRAWGWRKNPRAASTAGRIAHAASTVPATTATAGPPARAPLA